MTPHASRRRWLNLAMAGSLAAAWPAWAWASPPGGREPGPGQRGGGPGGSGHGGSGHGGSGHGGAARGGGGGADVSASLNLATAGITVSSARGLVVELGIDTGRYKPLPPGIRRNLARGKPLPPGIAKQSAPATLVARLPVHPGYEWQVIGRDLVLIAIATAIIADVLFDVF